LERKMREEEALSYATAGPRLSSSCGWLKGTLRIFTLSHLRRNAFRILLPREDQVGLQIPNLVGKSKRELRNCESPVCLIQIVPPTKLTNLQRKTTAKIVWPALPSH